MFGPEATVTCSGISKELLESIADEFWRQEAQCHETTDPLLDDWKLLVRTSKTFPLDVVIESAGKMEGATFECDLKLYQIDYNIT